METKIDFTKEFIALVEDNMDPKKLGRVRARVVNIFDDIEVDDLPWASPYLDTNGNTFNVPEVGKLVTILFHNGNPLKPQYLSAEHMNPNLQALVDGLDGEEYKTFKAIMVDQSTQIYRTSSKGLILDHEQSNINITGGGDIKLNLRDGGSKLYLGTEDAQQAAVLGTDFMDWFDGFLDKLLSGGFLGNMMKPLVPQPDLIKSIMEFKAKKNSNFLSNNVWIPENGMVKGQGRPYINSTGDNFKSNYFQSMYSVGPDGYSPTNREEEPLFQNFEGIPNDDVQYTISDDSTSAAGKYPNGKIPLNAMVKNKYLAKDLSGDMAYLMKDASNALDAMMASYNNSKFSGKHKITFTDGYRSYERQKLLYDKSIKNGEKGRAAKPGNSQHGLGICIDIWFGVPTKIYKTNPEVGFIHPVYQWFHLNAHKFGWYNPVKLRNGKSKIQEWWHWTYFGDKGKPEPMANKYSPRPYTSSDISIIKKSGGIYNV